MDGMNEPLVIDFNWDETIPEGETIIDNTEETEVVNNEEKVNTEEAADKGQPKEEEKEEIIVDKDKGESKEDESEKKEESGEEDVEIATLADYVEALKASGEIDEDMEIETLDDLIEINNMLIEKKVESKLNELTQKIGDVGVAFLKYVAQGGDPKKFIEEMGDVDAPVLKFIEGDSNNHKEIIRTYMKEKGFDDDDIELQLQALENSGKLEEKARLYYDKLSDVFKNKQEQLLKEQEKQRKEMRRKREEFENTIKKIINETNEINGYELTPKEKEELVDYILTPRHQTNDGGMISDFQKDLNEKLADPKNLLVLGILAKRGFDLSFIEKKLESKVTRKTKKIISKNTVKQENNTESIIDLLSKL